jgi:hypothetical protein
MSTNFTTGREDDPARAFAFAEGFPIDPGAPSTHGDRVTVNMVTEAIAEVMREANPGGIVDQPLAAKIGSDIRPSVQKLVSGEIGSGAQLAALPNFRAILNQYLASPASAYVQEENRKAMQRTLETANRSGSEFSSIIAHHGRRMAALAGVSAATMRDVARAEGHRSSAEFSHAFNGGSYTAQNLSGEMRGYVDNTRGFTASHVAGVGNYLSGIGINAQQYTGYFVGSSNTVRNAIRDHIANAAKITDEHIKNPRDVSAIIGAIKAGKIKREDAPPSVQKIMDDMKAKGMDPTDSKAFDKYFKDNPKALETFKHKAEERIDNQATKTDAAVDAEWEARIKARSATNRHPESSKPGTSKPPSPSDKSKPEAKTPPPSPG